MGATSVEGVSGAGSVKDKRPHKEDQLLWNSPAILISGRVSVEEEIDITSPPTFGAVVRFPEPFLGSSDDYVVIITPFGTGSYLHTMDENADNNFIGFTVLGEGATQVMYLVTKAGFRAR